MKKLLLLVSSIGFSLIIMSCSNYSSEAPAAETISGTKEASNNVLAEVLASKPDAVKARYKFRHPQQTLDFFGIKPGMTVVEALPGGGWYTKILLPYLGENGQLIGADYAADMYPKFGFFSEEEVEAKKTWVATWVAEAEQWRDADSAAISAFQFGSLPETQSDSMVGTVDAVVFIRALHNLARVESDGGYLTKAINDAYQSLKPGGIVGVVQHMVAEDAADEGADGSRGYLKKSFVIKQFEKAGFGFLGSSDINKNVKDQPGAKDIVWRLPPTFLTSGENPELKAKLTEIGESNRMTLTFRKPYMN